MQHRRHTPEQMVRKLREADQFLAEGADIATVARLRATHPGHVWAIDFQFD